MNDEDRSSSKLTLCRKMGKYVRRPLEDVGKKKWERI